MPVFAGCQVVEPISILGLFFHFYIFISTPAYHALVAGLLLLNVNIYLAFAALLA